MTAKEHVTPILTPDVLQRLREQYQVTALATVDGLRTLAAELASLSAASPAASALLVTLRDRLHQLHGSAGSYGLAEVSRLAAESERRVARWVSDPALEADERAAAIFALAAALESAVGRQ